VKIEYLEKSRCFTKDYIMVIPIVCNIYELHIFIFLTSAS
jgi:hypothetical protein